MTRLTRYATIAALAKYGSWEGLRDTLLHCASRSDHIATQNRFQRRRILGLDSASICGRAPLCVVTNNECQRSESPCVVVSPQPGLHGVIPLGSGGGVSECMDGDRWGRPALAVAEE